jgi:hypothetical protein
MPVPKYIYHPSFMVHWWEMNVMMNLNMYINYKPCPLLKSGREIIS